jgi:methylated-DNA-protein-cysteine methyltransferase-like protein
MSWVPVYRFVKSIPRGRVITYGQLAKALKLPGGARTAGFAVAATPNGQGIPWHRVVGAGGRLLTREPYASKQRHLLESEGTKFLGNRVDMERHQWKVPRRPRTAALSKTKSKK